MTKKDRGRLRVAAVDRVRSRETASADVDRERSMETEKDRGIPRVADVDRERSRETKSGRRRQRKIVGD